MDLLGVIVDVTIHVLARWHVHGEGDELTVRLTRIHDRPKRCSRNLLAMTPLNDVHP